MDQDKLPEVHFTDEEIDYLQNLLDQERASWFDYIIDICEEDATVDEINYARDRYKKVQLLLG